MCNLIWVKQLFLPRIELRTFRVLGGRDNHYTTETYNDNLAERGFDPRTSGFFFFFFFLKKGEIPPVFWRLVDNPLLCRQSNLLLLVYLYYDGGFTM